MEWTPTELIHQEQEKRSHHKYIPLGPNYQPPTQRTIFPCASVAESDQEILKLHDHDMHFQLPQDWPPSWTSRARMHLSFVCRQSSSTPWFKNHCYAVPFWMKRKQILK